MSFGIVFILLLFYATTQNLITPYFPDFFISNCFFLINIAYSL